MDILDKNKALALLGLSGSPDRETARQAYRTLAKAYHPDHVAGDAPAMKAAEERMKEINGAWQVLRRVLPETIPEVEEESPVECRESVSRPEKTEQQGSVMEWIKTVARRVKQSRGAGARISRADGRSQGPVPKPRKRNARVRFQDVLNPLWNEESPDGQVQSSGRHTPWENYQRHMAVKKQIRARQKASAQMGQGRVEKVGRVKPVKPVSR